MKKYKDPTTREPNEKLLTEVCLDDKNHERGVNIGLELESSIHNELVAFLKENIDSFA